MQTSSPSINQRALIIRGDLNSYSGYAYATRLYLEWVERHFDIVLGVDLDRHPARYVPLWPYPLIDDLSVSAVVGQPGVDALVLTISTPKNLRAFPPAKSVGLFFWETTRMGNPSWVERMNGIDEVWVPARFMQSMLEAEGVVTPVMFTPCPLPILPMSATSVPVPDITLREVALCRGARTRYCKLAEVRESSELLFLSTNSFIPRKAFPVLAHEWLNAVKAHPNAALVLKVSTVDVTESADRLYERVETLFAQVGRCHDVQSSRVYVCSRSLPHGMMQGLGRTCDAFLTCSFGEGLGLGVFESLLCGKPVICPRHTSFSEFLPADYPYFMETETANYGLADPVGVYPISAHWGVPREGSLLRAVDALVADVAANRAGAAVATAVEHFRVASSPRAWRAPT